jgi:hypothetical protein
MKQNAFPSSGNTLNTHLGETRVSKGQRSADHSVRGPVQHTLAFYFIWQRRAIGLLPKRPAEDHRLLSVHVYFYGTRAAFLAHGGAVP